VVVVIVGWVLMAVGVALACQASWQGSHWVWLSYAACQLPLAALGVRKMHRDGELWDRLQPKWGDTSASIGSAALLLALAWIAGRSIAPAGSTRHEWLTRLYAQAGASSALEQHWALVVVVVLVIALVDEIGWRGFVFPALEDRWGTRIAWPVCGLVYGFALVPSVYVLRTEAGFNPLVLAVGLLAGVVWSFLTARTQRLVPSIVSHAVFLWFVILQFRWAGLH